MTALKLFKTHANLIISLALAIAVIAIAMGQGRDLANALKQVRLSWAFAGLGCYGINYLLRALRIKVILKDGSECGRMPSTPRVYMGWRPICFRFVPEISPFR